MTFLEVNPKYRDVLAAAGLASAADFLGCAGEPVSHRNDRRVERIVLADGLAGYLKKENRILLRERLSSWWSGYGWTSKSVREGYVLGQLAFEKIGCPEVIALGEEDGQAFVLLKEERGLESLERFVQRRPDQIRRIASLLGRELARMHAAGFFHPDLFAKHVLVGQADGLDRICLIDWQRTRQSSHVPWSRRIIDLATLDASLAGEAVSERDRLRLLVSYLRAIAGSRPQLDRLIAAIRSRAWLLMKRRRIRRQHAASLRPVPSATARPYDWHGWHNCPLRLTDPSLAVLPLVKSLERPADDERCRLGVALRQRALRETGRALREVHDAGYVPVDPGLDSWVLHALTKDDVEVLLTSAADLVPTTTPPSPDDLARLFERHGSTLSRTEMLRVVGGYLGVGAPRLLRRELVRRILGILDAREPAR